jgi:hypothetical protein
MNNRVGFILIIFSFILLFSGCASLPREPVPIKNINDAEVIGIPNVRSWAGEVTEYFQQDIITSVEQERHHSISLDEQGNPKYAVLSLSGGGADGAFGAGFLNGWTRTGARPEFKIVSGVSTGALIAPFAFLGTDYDEPLKKVFTTVSTENIIKRVSIINLFSSEALTNTEPLKRLLKQYVTDDMIRQVANVHDQGRRLYIGTANMDSQRPVVWNMGLIAKSNHPSAPQLFRDVMLASASIPAGFPPVYIKVEVNGKSYDEMHSDGGTFAQVFFHGNTLDLKAAAHATGLDIKNYPIKNLYIIRNGQLNPEPEHIERKIIDIAARAIDTMIKASFHGDLYRIYVTALRQNIKYHYVDIPDSYESQAKEPFDQEEMNRLFQIGYELGQQKEPWQTVPPGLENYLEE